MTGTLSIRGIAYAGKQKWVDPVAKRRLDGGLAGISYHRCRALRRGPTLPKYSWASDGEFDATVAENKPAVEKLIKEAEAKSEVNVAASAGRRRCLSRTFELSSHEPLNNGTGTI
jgi:hypothetical protein